MRLKMPGRIYEVAAGLLLIFYGASELSWDSLRSRSDVAHTVALLMCVVIGVLVVMTPRRNTWIRIGALDIHSVEDARSKLMSLRYVVEHPGDAIVTGEGLKLVKKQIRLLEKYLEENDSGR